ncbi:hypothetical protein D770_22775 [Flammeovirgaceae bacterium 311]|nr:hypothetical protein D770_22775 [Flammeovirgaceae bacterium 311]
MGFGCNLLFVFVLVPCRHTGWNNMEKVDGLVRINGTRDKLIPYIAGSDTVAINNGEHFMIVDRAKEISSILEKP